MGTESYLIAVGKLQNIPKSILDYPEEFYNDVSLSSVISCEFGHQFTNHDSRLLAYAVGMSDEFDFNNCHIDSQIPRITDDDFKYLQPIIDKINSCIRNGIIIIFCPNG